MEVEAAHDRRTLLLDAALRVIGNRGLGAITHRSVEREADVPHGSTSYYFGTRDQLIAAAVQRLVELDHRHLEHLTHDLAMALARREPYPDIDHLLAPVISWIGSDRTVQLARYELELAGGRDAQVRATMSAGAAFFWRLFEPVAVAAGSRDAARDARMIVATLDGLLMDWLTHEPPDEDLIVDGFRRMLASLAVDHSSPLRRSPRVSLSTTKGSTPY